MSTPASSFQPLKAETLYRTIARSSGEVGSGKTRFWLTAPKPLYMQSLDKGLEGTVNQLIEEGLIDAGDVHIAEYDWHPGSEDFSQEYAEALRDKFIADYYFALDAARTIVWDKESDIWELFRYAEFGKPNTTQRQDYAKLNQRYLALINKAKGYDVSLGLIQSMKDAWGSQLNTTTGKMQGVKLGYREPWGFDRLDEAVFLELHHKRTKVADGASEFTIEVGKSRQNTNIQDQSFPGMTFAEFGTLLIPGSEEDSWR